MKRKVLLSMEELCREELFAVELLQKSSAKGGFAGKRLRRGAGRQVSVAVQSRDLCFNLPLCLGCKRRRAGATGLVWSPGSFGAAWLCPALLGTGSQAGAGALVQGSHLTGQATFAAEVSDL